MAFRCALVFFALVSLSACPDPSDPSDSPGETVASDDTGPVEDTGVDTGADTGDPDAFAFDIHHRVSEAIPTVAVVDWEMTLEVPSWVEFGPPGSLGRTMVAGALSGTAHRAALAGLREASDYEFQVVAEVAGVEVRSEVFAFETGLLPVDVPELDTVTLEPDALRDGYTVTTLMPGWDGNNYVVILDGEGEIVWAWPSMGNVIRADLSHDRTAVVFGTMVFPSDGGTGGTVLRSVSLDGEVVTDVAIADPMLDFAKLEDGWYAALVREGRLIGETNFYGDQVIRVGPEGQLEPIWSAFDAFEADPADYPGAHFVDWTHSNALDCDIEAGLCFVTVKYLQSIVAFDILTGETAWVLDKDATGFTTPDPVPMFDRPHSVAHFDEGLLVFDQADPSAGGCAGMMVYDLDLASGTVERTWSYAPAGCIWNDYLGNAEPLPDGGRLMTTGCAGVIEEVSEWGGLRRRQEAGLGVCLGYAVPVPTLD